MLSKQGEGQDMKRMCTGSQAAWQRRTTTGNVQLTDSVERYHLASISSTSCNSSFQKNGLSALLCNTGLAVHSRFPGDHAKQVCHIFLSRSGVMPP
jgi:predicted SAM-dependent methyltransferase